MTQRKYYKFILSSSLAPIALASVATMSIANAKAEDPVVMEEILVTSTGSRIKRQGDNSSPLISIGIDDIQNNGAKDIRDLIGLLSINAGSENNSDNLSQILRLVPRT